MKVTRHAKGNYTINYNGKDYSAICIDLHYWELKLNGKIVSKEQHLRGCKLFLINNSLNHKS